MNYKVLEELNIVRYYSDFLIETTKTNKRTTPLAADQKEGQERYVAVRFIRTCGQKDCEARLQNSFLEGQNNFPSSLAEARAIIDNHMQGHRTNNQGRNLSRRVGVPVREMNSPRELPIGARVGNEQAKTVTNRHKSACLELHSTGSESSHVRVLNFIRLAQRAST